VTTYIFRSAEGSVEITLTRAEGVLYVWMSESPEWEVPVFGAHDKAVVSRRPRRDLLERADRLVALLEPQADLLRFTYSLERPHVTGQQCQLGGREGTLECGAGYCQIVESKIVPAPNHRSASVVLYNKIADLRDLRPLVLDDGAVVRAKRKSGKHDLLGKARDLKRFLDAVQSDSIECSVSY
jgi:hypothetical protein